MVRRAVRALPLLALVVGCAAAPPPAEPGCPAGALVFSGRGARVELGAVTAVAFSRTPGSLEVALADFPLSDADLVAWAGAAPSPPAGRRRARVMVADDRAGARVGVGAYRSPKAEPRPELVVRGVELLDEKGPIDLRRSPDDAVELTVVAADHVCGRIRVEGLEGTFRAARRSDL